MTSWKRAVGLGFASWLIPFACGFAAFPLKKVNAPLFATVMALIVLETAGVMFQLYFRRIALSIREALYVAVLWCGINVVMDYPMFAYGPMKMEIGTYYSEIGLVYLVYPLYAFWAMRLAAGRRAQGAEVRCAGQ